MKIINIASFPPPIGGVSYFLRRLKSYTDTDNKDQFVYVDVSGKGKKKKREEGVVCISKLGTFFFLLFEPTALIVFHSNSVGHLFLHWIYRNKHRFIYFTHGESILKEKNRYGWRFNVISSAEALVTPTKELYTKSKEIFKDNCDVRHIPFIIYPRNIEAYRSEEIDLLRGSVDFVFSGYANSLIEYHGEDLYGIDMMIELIHTLNLKGYNVGIIILITEISDERKFEAYKKSIRDYNLEAKVIIVTHPIEEASSLYIASDAYLRPTNTDGDSFSIWESLYFGVPVLASDATQRPEGCVLFKNRSQKDLEEKAIEIIENYNVLKNNIVGLNISGNEKDIMGFLAERAR